MKTLNFCTLFDSNYADKGIVLFNSLKRCEDDFKLFVLAFDEKCEQIMKDISDDRIEVVPYSSFEDDRLREAKSNRTPREYLWTCSGYSIKYVIEKYNLDFCTYVDADLFFYSSPRPMLEKFEESKSDVAIIPHAYSSHYENKFYERLCGKYCVEFNTFKNSENGMRVLNWWIDECFKCCVEKYDREHFGDQKYIDSFEENFEGIYVYNEVGAGVAPWNVDIYRKSGDLVENIERNETGPLIFYHFHSLNEISESASNLKIFIRPGNHDKDFVYGLYRPYIKELLEARKSLDKYDLWQCVAETQGKRRVADYIDFLTCEPNMLFLVRKLWRYLRKKRWDIVSL